ncbi:MAG: carboxypeptidase-like regulatory domain-containing protein [Terriglobales bacterium]
MKSRNAIVKTARNFLSVCILFLGASSLALAQGGRGSISGVVSDPSGAIVSGAKVTALNHATGIEQHTVTSAAGLYSFVSLNPGLYLVTASQKGFENLAEDKVLVTVDQATTVNIVLRVGSVVETVTVSEAAALVDTTNSTVGQLIDSAAIDRVPLLTRNVFDLVQLSTGVTPANGAPNSSSSQAIINISSGRPGIDVSSYTINGAIQGSVYYMLDGSPLGVAENNIAAILPAMEIPEDGVEEFRVETQNTPASYQSGGAGVISLVSKSGGDQFHGDGFVVLRPDVLAANEYFNKQGQLLAGTPNQPLAFHRYQEGGAIGGPILHKKLFFFGDYEATQERLYDNSSIFTVPTTAEGAGDFSADPYTIYNPLAADNPDGTRQEFPIHNVITSYPGLTLNPTAAQFLSHFPKCNYPNPATCDTAIDPNNPNHLNNFQLPGLDPITAQRFDIRMDYYRSEKQRLFSRFSYDRLTTQGVNAFGNDWDPYYAQNITNARNFIIGDDYTINPTTVLQLRYSFTRHYENQGGDPGQNGFDITTLGFPASLAAAQVYKTLPIVFFNDLTNASGNPSGVGGTANYNTFVYASMNHDFSATLTKVVGKHELSFGAEYMKRFLNVGQPPASSGWYYFDCTATNPTTNSGCATPDGQPLGSDFASFLLGMGSYPGNESVNFTQDLFSAVASPYYAAFVEDTYHVRPNLTVTAGLRWDIFGGKTERHNRLEYFDPTAVGTSGPLGTFPGGTFTGGEVFATSGNRSPFTTNLTNFAPRLGFSWLPMQHLVVRGGAGFYYGPSVQMVSGSLEDSDGYSTSNNWNATCLNSDGNSVFNGTAQCNANVAGSVSSITGDYSLSNPFPVDQGAGLLPPSQLHPNGLQTNLGANLNTMLHSQRTALTYNFNFGLEYEFPHQIVLSAGYVGSRGLFLPLGNPVVDLNQLTLSQINQLGNAGAGVDQFIAAEPFPQFNTGAISITGQTNGVEMNGYPGGDSEYSSLQTKVQKRLTNHFTTLASFTWAKLMTDDGNPPLGFVGSHAGSVQDWRNMGYEHSVSPQDVKYQFTWQASYDLPVGKDRAVNLNGVSNAILGNWTANGIFYLSSGIPIASPDVGDNMYLNQRADMTCDPSKGAPHTATQWFTADCFAVPGSQFVPGSAPAYLDRVRTMGANNLDLTLSKNFKLGEERNLRFDISSYNVANKAQFSAPNVPSASSGWTAADGFGQITTTSNTPRQFQFGARFTF